MPAQPQEPPARRRRPGHPRTVKAPETRLDQIVGLFFNEHVFGPRRAELLAAQLPATDAAARAERDAAAAAISTRLKQIETGQNSCILELEQLPADPAATASAALRGRIRARFADLHHEREQLDTQLATLAAATPRAADPTLLDELPMAGHILPGLPAALKARLLDAFDIQILWNKPGRQATVLRRDHRRHPQGPARPFSTPARTATMTQANSTQAIRSSVEDLFETPIDPLIHH